MLCIPCRQNDLRGNPEDIDGGDEQGVQLIGVGHKVAHGQVDATLAPASSFIGRVRPHGWTLEDLQRGGANVRTYSQADLPQVGSVNSVGYSRVRSRVSYYVLHRLMIGRDGREEHRVAKVHSFMRLEPSEQQRQVGAEVLRLAVCDVYKPLKPLKDGAVYVIKKEAGLEHQHFALEVSGIEALLVSAEPTKPPAVPGWPGRRYYIEADVGKVFLTRFGNVSKMKAPL